MFLKLLMRQSCFCYSNNKFIIITIFFLFKGLQTSVVPKNLLVDDHKLLKILLVGVCKLPQLRKGPSCYRGNTSFSG